MKAFLTKLLAALFANSLTVCIVMFVTALGALVFKGLGFILAFLYFIGAILYNARKQ